MRQKKNLSLFTLAAEFNKNTQSSTELYTTVPVMVLCGTVMVP